MLNKIKIYKSTSIFFLNLLFLTSCNTDSSTPFLGNAFDSSGLKIISYGNNKGISGKSNAIGTTIATFIDQQAYDYYMDNLEQQADAWDDAFVAQWNYLDDDTLNAKEEELNFDSEKPLTDFENSIGLQSLRQKYLTEEDAWLNNDVLNYTTDPDLKPEYAFSNAEKTILNQFSEVQIGTTIYKQLDTHQITSLNGVAKNSSSQKTSVANVVSGAYLKIAQADYTSLIKFNAGDVSVVGNGNVSIVNPSTSLDCKYGKSKRAWIDTAPGKKIRVLIKVPQPRWGANGKVKSKVKSYKKRGRRWKKYRTNIYAGLSGTVYDTRCDYTPHHINVGKTKRKKKLVFKWHDYSFASHVVLNGGMKGVYKQGNVTNELALTW